MAFLKKKTKKNSKFQIFLNQLQTTCYNNEWLQHALWNKYSALDIMDRLTCFREIITVT